MVQPLIYTKPSQNQVTRLPDSRTLGAPLQQLVEVESDDHEGHGGPTLQTDTRVRLTGSG